MAHRVMHRMRAAIGPVPRPLRARGWARRRQPNMRISLSTRVRRSSMWPGRMGTAALAALSRFQDPRPPGGCPNWRGPGSQWLVADAQTRTLSTHRAHGPELPTLTVGGGEVVPGRTRTPTTRIPTCAQGFRKPHAHTPRTHSPPQRAQKAFSHRPTHSTHHSHADTHFRPRDRPNRPIHGLLAAPRPPSTPPWSMRVLTCADNDIWAG